MIEHGADVVSTPATFRRPSGDMAILQWADPLSGVMARLPAGLAEIRALSTSGLDLIVQMPLLSEAIHRAFPSFSLSMIRVDDTCAPREHYSEHFDEFSHQLFATSGHLFASSSDDPASFGRLLRNPRPIGALVRAPPNYLAGATYEHLFRRNGIHHCLDVAVKSAGGPLGILGIFRERSAPGFTTEDVARMATVYDDLVHAFEARALVGDFDEVESAVLVVDRRGTIEWASGSARAWLIEASIAEERGLVVDRSLLPAAVADLARSVRRAEDASPTRTLPVAGGRLRLRAYRLQSAANSLGEETKVAVQLSFEASRLLRIEKALHALGTPPRLREVATWLYRGEDARARLGVSKETFKSYRKELYLRLDVDSVDALRVRLDGAASTTRLDLDRQRPRTSTHAPSGG